MLALIPVDAATSLSAQGISVAIHVAETPAEVFVPTKIENVHSGFIISTQDAAFTVHVIDNRPNQDQCLSFDLFCDGECTQSFTSVLRYRNYGFIGRRTSSTTRLSYQFSNIQLSDDPLECTSNSEIIKGIGTVIMKVWRVKLIPRRIDSPSGWPAPTPSGRPIINEKLKKGMIPHTTGFGDSMTTPTWKQPSTDRRRMESVPWLTFTFNYRSREVLELQSIIEEEAPVIPLLPAMVDVEPIDNKRPVTLLDDSEGEEAGQGGGLEKKVKQEKGRVKAEKIGKVKKEREIIILSDSD